MVLTKPTTCCYNGCKAKSMFTPVILVWAKGFKRVKSQAIRVELSVTLCGQHRDSLGIDDIPELGNLVLAVTRARGLAEPDIKKMEMEMEPILEL